MAYNAMVLMVGLLTFTLRMPLAVAQTSSDLEAVKAANHALYLAVSARDVSAVQRVWASTDADIQNIGATSKAPAIGWDDIKKAYRSSFERFPEISVNMVEPLVRLHGQTAEVVGLERQILKQADEVVLRITTLGTNVFEKQPDGSWLLVSRHSSIPR